MKGGDEAMAAPVASSQPLEWKFSQVFGERTAGEEVQEGIFRIVLLWSMPLRFICWIQSVYCASVAIRACYLIFDLLMIVSE